MKTYHFPDMSVWNILDQLLVINSILRTREKANRPYGGQEQVRARNRLGVSPQGSVKHLSPHSGNHCKYGCAAGYFPKIYNNF